MRPFTSGLVVIMLAVAPVTVASAQVTQQQLQSIPVVIPPSLPDTSALDGRIPAPLQAPLQPPTVNGPVSLTPLPAQPPPRAAARARSSADARRGPFRFSIPGGSFGFPVPGGSFRFPIPDGSLAST